MDEERLREWVEEKLEQGFERDRIKKSLEETGHDPEIVDRVEDPFDDHELEDDLTRYEEEQDSVDMSKAPEEDSEPEKEGKQKTGKKFKKPSMPKVSRPNVSAPNVSRRVFTGLAVFVLLIGLVSGFAFFSPDVSGLVPTSVSNGFNQVKDVSNIGSSDSGQCCIGGDEESCPDVGVKIEDVSVSGGSTVADVLVVRSRAEVVLKVYQGSELLGDSTRTVEGSDTMSVNQVGNRVVFHPVGCTDYIDEQSY